MPARKRPAPDDVTSGGRRRSGRLSSTPQQKSKYFEDSDEGDEENEETIEPPKKRGRPAKRASLQKKESSDATDDYKDNDDEEEDEDEKDDDSEIDESAPMKVTVLPLEQMRGTGGVEYEDEKLHKNTLLFLQDLKANNERSWLKCRFPNHNPWLFQELMKLCSARWRVQKITQRPEYLRRGHNAQYHRRRRDNTRAPRQGRQLPHPPRHSLQQRPNSLQGRLPPVKPQTPRSISLVTDT